MQAVKIKSFRHLPYPVSKSQILKPLFNSQTPTCLPLYPSLSVFPFPFPSSYDRITAMKNGPQPTTLPPTKYSTNNCTAVSIYCPAEFTIYGYYPNLGANVFFCAFFALCLGIQFVLGIRYKTWTYMIALVLGTLAEAIGIFILSSHIHSTAFHANFNTRLCRKDNATQQPLVFQRLRDPNLLSYHRPCLHHRRRLPHPQTHYSRARRQLLPHPT